MPQVEQVSPENFYSALDFDQKSTALDSLYPVPEPQILHVLQHVVRQDSLWFLVVFENGKIEWVKASVLFLSNI